jgi:hypothetical protein
MRLPVLLKTILLDHRMQSASASEKKQYWNAATQLVKSLQDLSQRGRQVVQEIVGDNTFVEWEHYPENDVRDLKHASQYFYHAHTGLQRSFTEHGHFHLFVHAQELGLRPANSRYEEAPAHVIAVSMNAQGLPTAFFAVNRWVTKGPWLSYEACEIALDNFALKGRQGSRDINRFLTALVQLYRNQILDVIRERDRVMQKLSQERDRRSVFADRSIELLSYAPIALMGDIEALESFI